MLKPVGGQQEAVAGFIRGAGGRLERLTARLRSFVAIGQILVLDRKYLVGVDREVTDETDSAALVGELEIISAGRDAKLPCVSAGHMALVSKAGVLCRACQRLTAQEKLSGKAHPTLNDVRMRRRTQLASKSANNLITAHA